MMSVEHDAIKEEVDGVVQQVCRVILGKREAVRLSIACLLADGHLLIEDLPGLGKTTLAYTLAQSLGLDYRRVQFTSDLLPADVLGVSIYDRVTAQFDFHPGPIFSQMMLADEVNRATPRTQSALLEAMEENQITVEGKTRVLPKPFFVIATQNATNQVGTFPLPESQLDRFSMCLRLGYPDRDAEKVLLQGEDRLALSRNIAPVLTAQRLLSIQQVVRQVHVSDALLEYLQGLLEYSRLSADYVAGLSPRAGLVILRCAKAWALMQGRAQVLPEDLQYVFPSVVGHRLHRVDDGERLRDAEVEDFLRHVPVV